MRSTYARVVTLLVSPRPLLLLVATVFCAAAAAASTAELHDPDMWWVAAGGRELLASGALPRTNLFSFTEPERAWIFHEWLLGPLYAAGLQRFGPPFFILLTLGLLGSGLGLILIGTLGRARHFGAGLLLAFVALTFFGGRLLLARPSGVAQLFPLAVTLVAFRRRFSAVSAALVVALELVWANVHGSFPLGIAIVVVAAFDDHRDRWRRLAATLAAALVTCVNPYGLRLHRFVFDYAFGASAIHREIHASIYEFRSIVGAWGRAIHGTEAVGLALVTGLAGVAMVRPRSRLRASFCLLLIAAALLQVRHVELAGLLSCILLGDTASDGAYRCNMPDTSAVGARRTAAAILLGAASLVGLGLFLRRGDFDTDGNWVSQGPEFLRALGRVPSGANLYVPFSPAGLAIWYGFPRSVRVFYDSRNDCYSPRTSRAFIALGDPSTTVARRRVILDETGTNAALVTSGHALVSALRVSPEWSLADATPTWQLYVRKRRP